MSTAPFPERVAVLGAGTMGVGIALVFALAGARVAVRARREASLTHARGELGPRLAAAGANPPATNAASDRITFTTSLATALTDVDLVIETIAEELRAKSELLADTEELVAPGTVLTTNTSSLPIADLARALRRPQRFAGLHWINPPELVRLVEVVAGPETDESTGDALVTWCLQAGHRPVRVRRAVPGFIFNRLQYALLREAYALVAAGVASFEEVDELMKTGLGPRWAAIGPFEAMDLAGLDVHLAVVRRLFPELEAGTEAPEALERLVEAGTLGAKSGSGLRGDYDPARMGALARRRAAAVAALDAAQAGD